MSSPPSGSEQSAAFFVLDERIRRWIWQRGWTALKDTQERTIPLLVEPKHDVIVAAATASGKTEAAFLPILTRLAKTSGLALYVSPLKALINDQWSRLTELCERLEIPVTPWHGDVSQSRKQRFLKNPSGCLLITPESLEGLLMRNGHSLAVLLGRLEYVVVDELHAFIGDERGKQLQSLLHRVELALERRVVRVGLSATLGEMSLAAEFLRPGFGCEVAVIESRDSSQELRVIVRGYYDALDDKPENRESPCVSVEESCDPSVDAVRRGLWAVADDLYELRGANNLVFPNSRRNVEVLADCLREKCERERVPNEFWPHHGSLSKELREELERTLKGGRRPVTAIATTTLELGIDIGAVKSVAQVGPAPSVASLRQRLGRSGRRPGEPAILRCYCIETELDARSSLSDQLREGLVATVAQVRLLVKRWYEPPSVNELHLSTLIQQLLSLIAQYGGIRATDAWAALAPVFKGVTPAQFATMLRELGAQDILQQESSGLLLHAPRGERLVNHYTFLAAFVGDEEFRIVTAGRTLGSLPVSRPLTVGSYVIFAGRRWRVLRCEPTEKVIEVEPARTGQVPKFDGAGGRVHDEVRREMRRVLNEEAPVAFLDATATKLLSEARASYRRLRLDKARVIQSGNDVLVLTWRGDLVNDTLAVWLTSLGLRAENEGVPVVVFGTDRARVIDALQDVSRVAPPAPEELAGAATNLVEEKWDRMLPQSLLKMAYAYRHFDVAGAQDVCVEIVASELRRSSAIESCV